MKFFFDSLSLLTVPRRDLPVAMAIVQLLSAFVFGSAWGSFLNVVIARVPTGESVVHPRSRCPSCKTQIQARDNIPILSWVLLRAKCRTCGAAISWRYPFVELLVGLLGCGVVARYGFTLQALELFVFGLILTAIAFVDLDTWTVPHPLWIALATTGITFAAIRAATDRMPRVVVDRLMGGAGAGIALAAVVVVATAWLRRRGRLAGDEWAMGWGDPLILAGIGAYLGWQLIPVVVLFSSAQGAIVSVGLHLLGRLDHKQPVSPQDDWVPPKGAVPFGPFLALGGLEAAVFGQAATRFLYPGLDLLSQAN